jgi:chorismate mutase
VALQRTIRAGRLVFICCSTRRDAKVLYEAVTDKVSDLFRSREYEPEDWSRRVALVTGLNTLPKDILRTVEDFTEHFRSFSVSIATSVLETGVSLVGRFTHVFGHFKRLPIPHAAQAQLSARVRNADCISLLLERGQAGMFMGKVKQISAVLNIDLTSVEEALFNDTVADVMAEFADTYNRNDVLWQ